MRAVTRTTLTLGNLLQIPVGIAAATGSQEIRFETALDDGTKRVQQFVHPTRSRTLLAPPADGDLTDAKAADLEPVAVPEVVDTVCKGVYVGDTFRRVPPSELDYAKAATKLDRVELLEFVDYRRVPTDRLDGAFYVQPDPGFARPLRTLMRAMRADGKAMLVKWSLRDRQRLGVIRVREIDGEDVLLLNAVTFAAQWRAPDEQVYEPARVEVDAAEEARAVAAAQRIIVSYHGTGEALDTAEDELPNLLIEVVQRAHDGVYDEAVRTLELAAQYRADGLTERAAQLVRWAEDRWTHLVVVHEQVDKIVAEGGDDVGEKLAALVTA